MPPHLIRRKNRSNFYIRDAKTEISTGTSQRGLANQVLDQYRLNKLGIYRTPRRPMSMFVERYLEHCRTYSKETTVADRKHVLEKFKEIARDPMLSRITPDTCQDFLKARQAQGLSTERWNTERQYLNHFFNYLRMKPNPIEKVIRQKVVRSRTPKSLTQEEQEKLLSWTAENDRVLYRMAVVAATTGFRAKELANLWKRDVDFKRGVIRVTQKPDWKPKDYEERVIPLNAQARKVLQEQIMEYGHLGEHVFYKQDGEPDAPGGKALITRMSRAFKRCGIGAGGLHRLRHTFGSRYLEAGGTPKEVQELLGHANLATTQAYLHVTPERIKQITGKIEFNLRAKKKAFTP
jgi:integrase